MRVLASLVGLSLCPHVTSWEPQNVFLLNPVLCSCTAIYWRFPVLFKVGQQYRPLYMKTCAHLKLSLPHSYRNEKYLERMYRKSEIRVMPNTLFFRQYLKWITKRIEGARIVALPTEHEFLQFSVNQWNLYFLQMKETSFLKCMKLKYRIFLGWRS